MKVYRDSEMFSLAKRKTHWKTFPGANYSLIINLSEQRRACRGNVADGHKKRREGCPRGVFTVLLWFIAVLKRRSSKKKNLRKEKKRSLLVHQRRLQTLNDVRRQKENISNLNNRRGIEIKRLSVLKTTTTTGHFEMYHLNNESNFFFNHNTTNSCTYLDKTHTEIKIFHFIFFI